MIGCLRFITLFLFTFQCIFAQNRKIDSLLKILPTKHDTIKVQTFCQISRFYEANDPTYALSLADSAFHYAKNCKNKFWMGSALSAKGSCLCTAGKYDESIATHIEALKIFEIVKSRRSIANSFNALANAYMGMLDQERAEQYFLKLDKIASDTPRIEGLAALADFGLGNILSGKKKYNQSITRFLKAATYFQKVNAPAYEAMAYTMIGQNYLNDSNFVKAEEFFVKAGPMLLKANDEYGYSLNLINLGSLEMSRKNFKKAVQYYEESLEINFKRKAWDNIQAAALQLAHAKETLNEKADALKYYKIYMQYKDSVINIERNRSIAESETKYETEKKEAQLKIKNSELEKTQLKVTQRNNLIYTFGLAIIVFSILLLLVYKQFRDKKKANNLLQSKNHEIEKQSALIEEKNKDITDSINYSKFIQQAIIPTSKKVKQFLPESFVVFKPKDIVSGDFYLVEEVVGLVYLAVVDCTGHGVPGAMLSVFADSTIKNSISSNQFRDSPAAILSDLCFQFKSNLQTDSTANTVNDGVDMAICIIDKKSGKLRFSGARNGLLLIRNKQIIEFNASRSGISGSNKGSQLFYEDHFIDVEPGDKFYIYTDGFADQFGGEKGKKFKQKQLNALLLDSNDLPMDVQKKLIEDNFDSWKGALEQIDDVTLLGFKI